jgi:hypothetical protein
MEAVIFAHLLKSIYGGGHFKTTVSKNSLFSEAIVLRSPLSVFGPGRVLDQRVNVCCVLSNSDGDAKRIHGGLSWFGQRRSYVQRGESVVFPCI